MRDQKSQAQTALAELRADLDKLVGIHNAYRQSAEALGAVQGGSTQGQQMRPSRPMQEMNQSFNLQYLQLQQTMQQQNRQFTLVSNVMKTKHDTAKNAINNIR